MFYSGLGLRAGQGSIDDYVLLQYRTLVTRKAQFNNQWVNESIAQSRQQDTAGHDIDRRLLRMIVPMTIPVSFIAWKYVRMCEELQCSLHMRGLTHDIFQWWITEALQYTQRYETAAKAYYRMLVSSSMLKTSRSHYRIRVFIHVRDLTSITAVMYSMDLIDQDYLWSMDWSKVWSPNDLAVIPVYIFNAYALHATSLRLDQSNARNIIRWWNLKRALRDDPLMNAMSQLIGELREWKVHQDVLLNPPFSRVSSLTSHIDEDAGSAK